MSDVEMETGFQLLARLNSRPNIENIYPQLFNDGPHPQHVVEISGYSSTGKTFLITEIIAKCILPECLTNVTTGGKNSAVILINTDHHFCIATLVNMLRYFIKEVLLDENPAEIDILIKEALNRLIVLNCYDSQQFYVTFQNLDNMLSANRRISIVILDSILAYYWSDRLNGGIKKIHSYQKIILKSLQNITKEHKVVIMYTKTTNVSKDESNEECKKYPVLEKINCKINLAKCDEKYSATVTLPDNISFTKYFKINHVIEWL